MLTFIRWGQCLQCVKENPNLKIPDRNLTTQNLCKFHAEPQYGIGSTTMDSARRAT